MFFKLATSNAKRSVKDYLIYIVTITIAFSLMFSFNLISNSKDILELADMMKNFRITGIEAFCRTMYDGAASNKKEVYDATNLRKSQTRKIVLLL